MTRFVNLEQGSEPWKEWRRERCMASEAPIVMGVAPDWRPVRSWEDLREIRAGFGDEEVRSVFLEFTATRGHRIEEEVRGYLAGEFGDQYLGPIQPQILRPAVVEHADGLFAASLDGITGDGMIAWLEAKAPVHGERSKTWKGLYEAKQSGMDRIHPRAGIVDDVWWQLVHQAYVLEKHIEGFASSEEPHCLLACIIDRDLENERNIYRRVPVQPLLDDAERLIEEWERFLSGARQIPSRGPAFLAAASRYRIAKGIVEAAQADMDEAKKELIAQMGDLDSVKEGGVSITKVTTKGRVNWQSMAKDFAGKLEIDATAQEDDFRGKEAVSYRVLA